MASFTSRPIGERFNVKNLKVIKISVSDVGENTRPNLEDGESVIFVYRPVNEFAEYVIVGKLEKE